MKSKQNILIVDDNTQLNEMLKIILESENFIIKQAYNGKEAFKISISEDIDLVIMDLMMPQMNGESAIKAIYHANPKTKFIIISGNMGLISKDTLRKYNVIGFFDKPFHIPEIIDTIKLALSS
ncbi:MAG TPA: response regulator [Exilispira sp.]|nr:response regulator [Exilispira sp.]